ncbi:MAG TPA: Druantia anti-phage system protein DruA [Candidatus Nanoarchaeia archaeon]|nr:Druantia anti-phage system protein DruA [Candidatus Nanoarchaeia archaeon]
MKKLQNRKILRKKVLRYLRKIGYSTEQKSFDRVHKISKDQIRKLHIEQRKQKLKKENILVQKFKDKMLDYLASGNEIIPEKIEPELIEVKSGSKEAKIFRFAALNWSIPVSDGYGRRMRFLVRDKQNSKLIGIFALGDPVYNIKARDNWIGWSRKKKAKRLVNVMDAYVLGALPPYSNLICGKLIASLITSKEVQKIFNKKYGKVKSIIKKRKIKPKLVLLTTSSALGKSSIYDRLKLNGQLLFEKVGETQGYGHFHIPDKLFNKLRDYLKRIKHPYADGYKYGQGANWRFRVIRKSFSKIGLTSEFLSHGIRREVYMIPLAKNTKSYLCGRSKKAIMKCKSIKEISELCKTRWIVPRSIRDNGYLKIDKKDSINKMINL